MPLDERRWIDSATSDGISDAKPESCIDAGGGSAGISALPSSVLHQPKSVTLLFLCGAWCSWGLIWLMRHEKKFCLPLAKTGEQPKEASSKTKMRKVGFGCSAAPGRD